MDFQPHPVFPSLWLIGPRIGAAGPETVLTVICKGSFAADDPSAVPLADQEQIRLADEPLDQVVNGDFAEVEESGTVPGWDGDAALRVVRHDDSFPHMLAVTGPGAVLQRLRFDAPLGGRRFALSYYVRDPGGSPRASRAQAITVSGTALPGVGLGPVPQPVGSDPAHVVEEGAWAGSVADREADLILHGRDDGGPVRYDVVTLIEGAATKPHGNLRHEHDLALRKPSADIVVLGPPAPPATALAALFWTERVELAGRTLARTFNAVDSAEPLTFGWVTRTENPRLALAGTDLEDFDPTAALLPDDFDDAFHNGGRPPTSGGAVFESPAPGSAIVVATAAGGEEDVTRLHLPVAFPRATLTRLNPCDCPIDEDLPLRADTIVYDKTSGHFTVVWRGARPLDPARLARFPRLRLRGGG